MHRRYAILDDNQRLLERRIEDLRRVLPDALAGKCCAAMIIGSASEGRARDASDLDLLVVLADGGPRRSDYDWWEREISPRLPSARDGRFPVQPIVIGQSALATTEPNLRRAMRRGLAVWDPEGLFGDEPEARA
jgi:predicted nucleotidyltransferase